MTSVYTNLEVLEDHVVQVGQVDQVDQVYIDLYIQMVLGAHRILYFLFIAQDKVLITDHICLCECELGVWLARFERDDISRWERNVVLQSNIKGAHQKN